MSLKALRESYNERLAKCIYLAYTCYSTSILYNDCLLLHFEITTDFFDGVF